MKQMRGASREGSPPLAFLLPNRTVHLWWSHSGGSRSRHPACGGTAPWQGQNIPMLLAPARIVFAWGSFSVRAGRDGQSRCQSLQGRAGRGPVRQTGEGRPEIFLCGRHAGSRSGMSGRLRCLGNFFRATGEKKAQSGRCKNIFYDTRLPGSGGQALLPPKAEKSAIARKKILPAVKKT